MMENKQEDKEHAEVKAAREKYVAEHTKELLFSMNEEKIPKGIKFSFLVMNAPLIGFTLYAISLSPVLTVTVSPTDFAAVVRTCTRLF